MAAIQKVALIGPTGNVGAPTLKALLEKNFQVTVLTREGSTHTFPPAVTVAHVDYSSVDSLTKALTGQDTVIVAIATEALDVQLRIIDAAAEAGVKRIIPSEFGSDSFNPKLAATPVFSKKAELRRALEAKAASSKLTYSVLINGPFLDWGVSIGWLINAKEKSITLWDGGNHKFSTTTLPAVGRAAVAILEHPEETKNRPVYVQERALSLRELLALGKKAVGAEGWTETVASSQDLLAQGYAELKKDKPDPAEFVMKFITGGVLGEGFGGHFQHLDNKLLGIPELSDEEIVAIIKASAN